MKVEYKYVFGILDEEDVVYRIENDKLLTFIEKGGLMGEIIASAVEDLRDWVDWTAGDAIWDALDKGVYDTTGKHIAEWEEA